MIESLSNREIRKELQRAVDFVPRAAETIQELLKMYYPPGRLAEKRPLIGSRPRRLRERRARRGANPAGSKSSNTQTSSRKS
jgi:hypothetical protein